MDLSKEKYLKKLKDCNCPIEVNFCEGAHDFNIEVIEEKNDVCFMGWCKDCGYTVEFYGSYLDKAFYGV